MNNKMFIIVSGFGWSGSSAVFDLLKEFDKVGIADTEFRLINDPYGIKDLKHNLVDNWSYINSSAAIENFLLMAKRYSRNGESLLKPFGLSYKKVFGKAFYISCEKYVNNLTYYRYYGTSAYHKAFKSSYFNYCVERISKALSRRIRFLKIPYKRKKLYFSRPTNDEFVEKTISFINELFEPLCVNNDILLLDQAVSPFSCEDIVFFENSKMIVVDRDPKDIYADLILSRGLIGDELAKTRDVDKFIKWYKAGREAFVNHSKNNDKVLLIKFEDLVLDYDNSLDRIIGFLGIDPLRHINKQAFFKPDLSKKNIGLFVSVGLTEQEIKAIENNCKY